MSKLSQRYGYAGTGNNLRTSLWNVLSISMWNRWGRSAPWLRHLFIVSGLVMLSSCLAWQANAAETGQPQITSKEVIDREKLKRKALEDQWSERRQQFWDPIYQGLLAKATEVRVYKTIAGVDLRMYVFRPKDSKSVEALPAILLFHGGGWGSGDPGQFAPHCLCLASRGMVAMAVEYRFHSKRYTPVQALSNF